jgi:hypothetical protein
LGLCIRIWDNLFVYGTRYIFQVSLAILKLIEDDLLQLDLSGINDYFKSFKDDDNHQTASPQAGAPFAHKSLLPPIETIISESLKIKLNEEFLDQKRAEYKQLHAMTKQSKKNKVKKLSKVK